MESIPEYWSCEPGTLVSINTKRDIDLKYYHLSINIEQINRDEAIKSLKNLIDEIEIWSVEPEHYINIIGHCETQKCDPPIPHVYLSGEYRVYPKDCVNDYIISILKS